MGRDRSVRIPRPAITKTDCFVRRLGGPEKLSSEVPFGIARGNQSCGYRLIDHVVPVRFWTCTR